MIILRSVLFSFSVFWRLTLVTPFVLMGLCVVAIMLVLWLLGAALFQPLLMYRALTILAANPEIIFVGTLTAAFVMMSVIPMMIGSRLGLEAKGADPRGGYGGIILPCLGYGFFEGLIGICLFTIGFGIFMLLSPLTLADLGVFFDAEDNTGLIIALSVSWPLIRNILIGIGVAIVAFRAAMLVPLAGASINRDPDGSPHTPFMGFGSRFFSMLVVIILAYAASALVIPGLEFVSRLIGLPGFAAIATAPHGLAPPVERWQLAVLIGVLSLSTIWVFSIQCAAGTLAYLANKDRYEAVKAEEAKAFQMEAEEIRGLWKSRMPPGNR